MEYTYSSTNWRNYEKKLGLLKNKICTNLFYVDVLNWTLVKLDHFPCLACDGKSPPQRRIVFWAKKLICIGEKSGSQTACLSSEVKKYTAELSFGSSRNTLSRRAQMSTEICAKLFTRRRIKRRDRRRSFSISLNFYQTILESSPQTRFMFDIKKIILLLSIYALTSIPGETQDDPLRIAIDLPEFCRIPKAGNITDYSKSESTGVEYNLQHCVTPQLSFLLFRFVTFHYDMKLIYCSVLFLRRF